MVRWRMSTTNVHIWISGTCECTLYGKGICRYMGDYPGSCRWHQCNYKATYKRDTRRSISLHRALFSTRPQPRSPILYSAFLAQLYQEPCSVSWVIAQPPTPTFDIWSPLTSGQIPHPLPLISDHPGLPLPRILLSHFSKKPLPWMSPLSNLASTKLFTLRVGYKSLLVLMYLELSPISLSCYDSLDTYCNSPW